MPTYRLDLIKSAAVAALMLLLPTSSSFAQDETTVVPFLSCPLGCSGPRTDTALAAEMARAGSKILPAAQETPGFIYNIRAMTEERRWKTSVFGTEPTVIQAAFQGGNPEFRSILPEPIRIKFKLLYGQGYVAQGKFFVTFDQNIKSIADLKGKTIAIGLPTQSDWGMVASLLLEHGYGITDENTTIHRVSPPVMTQQLIDGHVDAALLALMTNADRDIWWTASLTSKLDATGRKLHYLPMSEEAIQAVNKKFQMTLLKLTVPAGTLPDQTDSFLAGANRAYQTVHPDFPEDLAYNIVMAVSEHAPKLRKARVGLWKFWSPMNMVSGMTEETAHPGAIKAYKELGWWDLRKKTEQEVSYPTFEK